MVVDMLNLATQDPGYWVEVSPADQARPAVMIRATLGRRFLRGTVVGPSRGIAVAQAVAAPLQYVRATPAHSISPASLRSTLAPGEALADIAAATDRVATGEQHPRTIALYGLAERALASQANDRRSPAQVADDLTRSIFKH